MKIKKKRNHADLFKAHNHHINLAIHTHIVIYLKTIIKNKELNILFLFINKLKIKNKIIQIGINSDTNLNKLVVILIPKI